jgi:hypothetical protein
MMVGYVAQCAVHGITLESLEIETDGEIDLRGFLGIDPTIRPGYENLSYVVRIKGSGTKEQFADPQGGDGELAQFLQRVPAGGPQTDPCRRVIAGSKGRGGCKQAAASPLESGFRLPTQPATGTARSRRTRSACKDSSSVELTTASRASVGCFGIAEGTDANLSFQASQRTDVSWPLLLRCTALNPLPPLR